MRYFSSKKIFVFPIISFLVIVLFLIFSFNIEAFTDVFSTFSKGGLVGIVWLLFGFLLAGILLVPVTPLFLLTVGSMSPFVAFGFIVFAVVIASIPPFLLARRFGEQKFHRILHQKYPLLDACDHVLAKYGFYFVLALHIFPVVPLSITNYLCGLSKIKFSHFILGTIFGTMPIALLYCMVSLSILRDAHIAMVISLIFGSIGVIVFGVYFFRRWIVKFGGRASDSSSSESSRITRLIVMKK